MDFTRIRHWGASLRAIRLTDLQPSRWLAACPLRRSLNDGLTRWLNDPRIRAWTARIPPGRESWATVRPWMPCVVAGGIILAIAVAFSPSGGDSPVAMKESQVTPQQAGLSSLPPAVAGHTEQAAGHAEQAPQTQPALAQATPDARARFQERLAQRRAAQPAPDVEAEPILAEDEPVEDVPLADMEPELTFAEQEPVADVPPEDADAHEPPADAPPFAEEYHPDMLLEAEEMQVRSEEELERLREAARASVDPQQVIEAGPIEPDEDGAHEAFSETLDFEPVYEPGEHEAHHDVAEHHHEQPVEHEAPPWPAEVEEVVEEVAEPADPAAPPSTEPTPQPARPGAQRLGGPRTPVRPVARPTPPVRPQPGQPVQPGQPEVEPQPGQPGQPARPGRPGQPVETAEPPQPVHAQQGMAPLEPAAQVPDLKQPGWWRLPPEERPYFFSWNNVTLEKACQDLVEMSGLSMIGLGQIDQPSRAKQLSIQSVRLLDYDEALTLFNELIVDLGFWVTRREQFLVIRPLTEWYRHIPPHRMYHSRETYEEANLPDWEVASVIYQPRLRSAAVLAQVAIDNVPLNTARATVVEGTSQVELKGFVLFINRQLEYLDGNDFKAEDGRYWVEYRLQHAEAAEAANLLQALMPTAESTAAPAAAPASRRPLPPGHPAAAMQQEAVGSSTLEMVEIHPDTNQRRMLVKASKPNHELAKQYLQDFIDLPPQRQAKLVTLDHIDPAEAVELIRPLLGERQIIQVPVPQQQRPGQPAQPPAMRPQQVTVTSAILTPVPAQRSILVKGNQEEMAQVQELVDLIDKPRGEDQAKFQYVQLDYANAAGLANLLTQAFGTRPQRGVPSEQQFRAVADQQNDRGLVITGEPPDLAHARELIAKLDVDPEGGAVEHLVKLENTSPSSLADILSNRYGGGGRMPRGPQGSALPRFIPEEASRTLIVLAHQRMWPDIERLIREIDENSIIHNRTKLYRLKHASAASLANTLNQSFGGMRGGRRFDDTGPTFQFEQGANILLVNASETMHERIAELVNDLDQPGPGDEATFQPIELAHADAGYVAEKLQEMLGASPRHMRDQTGRVQTRIVAEPVSNRVLVMASPEDFKQAETLARQIDEEYESHQVERRTFALENATPSQVARVVQTMFPDTGGPRGSSAPGAVRVVEGAVGIVVMAPRDRMTQIEALVQELDADPTGTHEIRSYTVEGAGAEGTQAIARTLEQLFSTPGASHRGGGGTGVRFIGDRGSELLFVSAPPGRMAEIDAKVQEILAAQGSRDTTFAIRHFDVHQAQPEDLAEMILPLLMVKYEELQQASGGRRTGTSPQIVPHRAQRRVMVAAPEALMGLVGELITDFDQTPTASVTRMVMLKNAKASEIAPVISETIDRRSTTSSPRRWFRSSWRGGESPTPPPMVSGGSRDEDLQVTAVESSNAILLRGPEVKVYEAQELIAELDEHAIPSGPMIRVYQIQHASVFDVVSMIEDIVGGAGSLDTGSRRGAGTGGGVIVKTDFNRRIIVSAPAERFPLIEQLIETQESLALVDSEMPVEDDGKGMLVGRPNTRGEITKAYDIQGPVEETAKYLDRILLSLLGWSEAPYVKSFPFARQILITGKPEYFKTAEEWLEKLEVNPPPVTQVLMVRRVPPNMPPSRVLEQVQQHVPGVEMNIAPLPGRHDGKQDPLALIREITYDEPIVSAPPAQPAAAPFVPTNTVSELRSALSAVVLAQATVTTAPAEAAPVEEEAAPELDPVLQDRPLTPTIAAPLPAPAPAAVAEAPPAPAEPDGRAQAFGSMDAAERDRVQVRYNEETGEIYIIGPASQVSDIQSVMDRLIDQARELAREGLEQPIRVFRVEHVDVNVAAAILEQMFNATPTAAARAAQQQAQRGRRQQGQPQPPGQPAAGQQQDQDEEEGARRRRDDGREEQEEDAKPPDVMGTDQIRVFPDARTRTLVIRAAEELFAPIAELLLKIDRPGDRDPVDIQVFPLQKLNAYEVEQAIKAILKIDEGLRPGLRQLQPGRRGAPGMPGGIDAQAQMIEALQAQMLEMQATVMEAEAVDGQPGRTMLNPARDITITSDATTNTIIVRAPEDGMRLVEKLIKTLEDQEIPLRIRSIPLQHGDAEKVAVELEKIFGGTPRRGPAAGAGEGVTPSRMGEVRISADSRTNTIVIRALEPDLEKIEPIIAELDVETLGDQMQVYSVEHGSAPEMAATLSRIFVADDKATGARAIRITADADTNTVLVWAPEQQQPIIAERLRDLDGRVESRQTPRQIELVYASPSSVAARLQSVFIPRGTAGRGLRHQVIIEGDDNSGLLFVVAPDETFARVQELAKQLDTPTRQDIRVFRLEHASASDVLGGFKDMTAQLIQQMRGGPGAEMFAATADQRTNSLIVTGTPATFLVVDKVLAELDVAPVGTAAVNTAMFALTSGNAASIAKTINDIFRQQKWLDGMPAPYAVAEPTANLVYVYGTKGQIDSIKSQVIDPYEAAIGPAAGEMKDYQIPIKYAKVEDVASTLGNWFTQRRASLQTAGGPTIRPSELAVTIVPDAATRQLLVVCTENNKKLIDELLAVMDRPEVHDVVRQTRVFPLKHAQPHATANAITAAFGRTGAVSESEQIRVVAEAGTNSLIVSANAENLHRIEEMIGSLDRDNLTRALTPETVRLEHARATEVASMLTTTIAQTFARDRAGRFPVSVTANDATNTLLVSGNGEALETVMALVKTLDVPPSMDVERGLKPYTLRYADVSSVTSAINATFQSRSGNPRDAVQAVAEIGTLSVIVMATPENHDKVQTLIEELDQPGTGTRSTFPIDIVHAEPEDVAAALTEIYATSARDRRGRPAASFTVPRGASKLLVTCTESELSEIQALIAELDVQTSSARDVQIVPVRHVTPTEMANLLTEFMRKPGRTGRADPSLLGDVKIAASTSASAVVLTGPADRLTELAELAAKIDAVAPEQAEHGRRVNVIALKNADPSSVATVINQSFARPGTTLAEAERVTAVAEWTTGTVVVTATETKMADVNKMIQELDQEVGNAPLQEIVGLDHARAEDLATVLMTTYRTGRRARQSDQPIAITAEPTSNTLVLSAGRADIEGIKAMIAQLDQPASDNVEALRVVPLQFMDATETLTIMQEYLRKPGVTARGGQSQLVGDIRLQASPTMNALIVSGRERDLDRVVDIVREMDQEMPGAGMAPRIIPLEHAIAAQLAATLTRLFSDPAGRARTRSPTDVAPLIIADETSNSLVVRAKPLDYNLIADMAQKLDVESTGASGIELIPLPLGLDVRALAQQIETTVNRGQTHQAQQFPGTRPPQVAIGFVERPACLFVSGSPELFPNVRQLVEEWQNLRPWDTGNRQTAVIRTNNINPQEMKRILEQVIYQNQRPNN